MAPWVARSSAAVVLAVCDRRVLGFHGEGLQHPATNQFCMKTISCHQLWLMTWNMWDTIHVLHSRLMILELGQLIRNDFLRYESWLAGSPLMIRDWGGPKSRVMSHESLLATPDLGPRVRSSEPSSRDSWLKKLYLIGLPNLWITNCLACYVTSHEKRVTSGELPITTRDLQLSQESLLMAAYGLNNFKNW